MIVGFTWGMLYDGLALVAVTEREDVAVTHFFSRNTVHKFSVGFFFFFNDMLSIDESELLSTATLRVDDFLPFQVSMDHFTAEDVAEQCCYKLETLMALYDCQFQRLRNTLKNKLWKSQGSVATVIEK